jgi:RNA polymerase sigma factor (sigma-70 family)
MACGTEIDEKKYLRLIPAVLKTHFRRWESLWEDMYQEGYFGLRYGVRGFNQAKVRSGKPPEEAKENYVYNCIRNSLKNYLTENFHRPTKQGYFKPIDKNCMQRAHTHIDIDLIQLAVPFNEPKIDKIENILFESDIPKKYKIIVALYSHGKSFAEIARIYKCSRQNIEWLYKNAIKKLKVQHSEFFDAE